MEDLIQFLIIIGVLFLGFVIQNKKKKRQTPEEAFPPVLDYEEEEMEIESQKQAEPFILSSTQTTPVRSTSHYTPVPLQKNSTQSNTSTIKKESSARRINLRSSQKAREAFIYSEIFTRKYQ